MATVLERPVDGVGFYVEKLTDSEWAASRKQGPFRALFFPEKGECAQGSAYGTTPETAKTEAAIRSTF